MHAGPSMGWRHRHLRLQAFESYRGTLLPDNSYFFPAPAPFATEHLGEQDISGDRFRWLLEDAGLQPPFPFEMAYPREGPGTAGLPVAVPAQVSEGAGTWASCACKCARATPATYRAGAGSMGIEDESGSTSTLAEPQPKPILHAPPCCSPSARGPGGPAPAAPQPPAAGPGGRWARMGMGTGLLQYGRGTIDVHVFHAEPGSIPMPAGPRPAPQRCCAHACPGGRRRGGYRGRGAGGSGVGGRGPAGPGRPEGRAQEGGSELSIDGDGPRSI
jgi:hypothetical protein